MRLKCWFLVLITSVLLPAKLLQAQTPLEVVDVTGSRIQSSNLGGTSSLSRAQIKQINPISTLDLLRRFPHVLVAENATGGASFVSIRGGESNFALILINGVVVNDTTNSRGGGFDFSQINPQLIERIEVYRGGVSSVYGGEAISGVIHIFMRSSPVNTVSIELGNQDQQKAQGTFSADISENIQISAGAAIGQRKQSSIAQQQNQQGLLQLKFVGQSIKHQVLFTYSQTDNVALPEDSGGFEFAQSIIPEIRESEQWLLGLNSSVKISDKTSVHSTVSWMKHDEASNHPGIPDGMLSGIPASVITSGLKRASIDVYANHNINQKTTIVAGINHRNTLGKNEGTLDFGFPLPVDYVLKQKVNSAFFETQFTPSAFSITLGWRIDDASGFASETSKRIATGHHINDSLRAFASYDQGYKLPSFFALAHPLVGNLNLQPERSKNREIGLAFQQSSLQLSASVFDNQFIDLVDFDPEQFININRSRVNAKGLEINANANINSWLSGFFDVTYADVKAASSALNTTLRRRPKWAGSVGVNAQFDSFSILATLDARDRILDSSIATGFKEVAGYAQISIAGTWQYSPKMQFNFNIGNVLSQSYQESLGFVSDETTMRAGFTYYL